MMLLAHVDPMNSTAVVPDHGRRTPSMRQASTVGSLDHGIGWLSRQWRRLSWFVVAGAMVCCVLYHTLDITVIYSNFRGHYNYITHTVGNKLPTFLRDLLLRAYKEQKNIEHTTLAPWLKPKTTAYPPPPHHT